MPAGYDYVGTTGVLIDATSNAAISHEIPLKLGVKYFLKATGTHYIDYNQRDADSQFYRRQGDLVWVTNGIRLEATGVSSWGTMRDFDAEYGKIITGTGSNLVTRIRDSRYDDNSVGDMRVNVYEQRAELDLDVDSDNNNGFDPPSGNDAEDQSEDVENDPLKPGKILVLNDDDGDSDGVPDFADGYNLDAGGRNQTGDDAPPTAAQGERFAPLVIRVPKSVDMTKAWLKIEYNESTPGPVTAADPGVRIDGAGTEADPYRYTAEPGELRLWTKDGSTTRNWRPFNAANSGDLVHATNDLDRYYEPPDWAKFIWSDSSDGRYRQTTLWVEAIAPSAVPGDQRVVVKVDPDGAGGVDFIGTDTVRFTSTQVAFIRDDGGDRVVDNADRLTPFARIGHWGEDVGAAGALPGGPANGVNGYYAAGDTLPAGAAAGDVRNQVGSAANNWDNFIDRDPDRFYLRVIDPTKNASATSRDTVTVTFGTLNISGAQDDEQTQITLSETANDSGVFVSESQLLTAPNLTGVAAADQDDGFPVASALTGGTVGDEDPNDRTHRATIDSAMRVEYGPDAIPRQIPVSRRAGTAPDERRELQLRVHVFLDPWTDANGDGIVDPAELIDINGDGLRNTVLGTSADATAYVASQIQRATTAWAQAGIRLAQAGNVLFENAPNDASGINIIADRTFDWTADNDVVTTAAAGVSPNVLELYFVAQMFDPALSTYYNAVSVMPVLGRPGVGENTFAFIGLSPPPVSGVTPATTAPLNINLRTLAHELGHAFDNHPNYDPVAPNPPHVFYPANTTYHDDSELRYRRVTHATETRSRTARAPGSITAAGSRLLTQV